MSKIIKIEKTCKCGCTFSYEKDEIYNEIHPVLTIRKCVAPQNINNFINCPNCEKKIFLWTTETENKKCQKQ